MKANNQDHKGNIPKPTSKDLASTNSGHSDCLISTTNLSPLASLANLLQQTEDQIPSSLEGPLVTLLPPLLQEDYLLSLREEEGISDLFDACVSLIIFCVNSLYKPILLNYETRTCVMQCYPFFLSSPKIVSWSKLQTSEQSWHFNELKQQQHQQKLPYQHTVTGSLGKALPCPRQSPGWVSKWENVHQVSLTRPLPPSGPPTWIGLLCLRDDELVEWGLATWPIQKYRFSSIAFQVVPSLQNACLWGLLIWDGNCRNCKL